MIDQSAIYCTQLEYYLKYHYRDKPDNTEFEFSPRNFKSQSIARIITLKYSFHASR